MTQNKKNMLNKILEAYPDVDFVKAHGFDDAIIGVSTKEILIYSVPKTIDILIEEHGMSYIEATEYFHHNIEGAYIGEKTPIWVTENF